MPVELIEHAFDHVARTYLLTNHDDYCGDLEIFFWSLYEELRNEIVPLMEIFRIRGRMLAKVQFIKLAEDNSIQQIDNFFLSSLPSNYINTFDEWFYENMNALQRNLENFKQKSSAWIFNKVISAEVKLSLIDNLHGGSNFILPDSLKRNRGILNVYSPIDLCFLYSILSILCCSAVSGKNRRLVSTYNKYLPLLKTDGISFPVQFNDISKFERQ